MDTVIKLALEIIEKKFNKRLRVAEVAECAHLSPSRFEHLLKQETGQNFKTLVLAARMREADHALLDLTMRIKDVTTAAGFPDVPNFNHYFRKWHGQSPSQFRRSRAARVIIVRGRTESGSTQRSRSPS